MKHISGTVHACFIRSPFPWCPCIHTAGGGSWTIDASTHPAFPRGSFFSDGWVGLAKVGAWLRDVSSLVVRFIAMERKLRPIYEALDGGNAKVSGRERHGDANDGEQLDEDDRADTGRSTWNGTDRRWTHSRHCMRAITH